MKAKQRIKQTLKDLLNGHDSSKADIFIYKDNTLFLFDEAGNKVATGTPGKGDTIICNDSHDNLKKLYKEATIIESEMDIEHFGSMLKKIINN